MSINTSQKYTIQSTGVWERIRRLLAVDPNRSNGVPLNPQFRNPPPGSNPPHSFIDPVTMPAGDIAGNAYFMRDTRRAYPRLSVVSQSDVVGLLAVGSAVKPKVELIGEKGAGALVEVKQKGEMGLATYLRENKGEVGSVLGEGGLPPLPSGVSFVEGGKKYELTEEDSYGGQ